jgi:hypothetical protein
MKLQINLTLDNAAFADYGGLEVARILRNVADAYQNDPSLERCAIGLLDCNGNSVGTLQVTGRRAST